MCLIKFGQIWSFSMVSSISFTMFREKLSFKNAHQVFWWIVGQTFTLFSMRQKRKHLIEGFFRNSRYYRFYQLIDLIDNSDRTSKKRTSITLMDFRSEFYALCNEIKTKIFHRGFYRKIWYYRFYWLIDLIDNSDHTFKKCPSINLMDSKSQFYALFIETKTEPIDWVFFEIVNIIDFIDWLTWSMFLIARKKCPSIIWRILG